ncbi:OmpA family protein [Marivibrio halodurans]|uniref:OmpA family protein n=1 Tax=Marivibrio halodurans TaxID=2039722 RepID=A0A8J7S162_9PROT|nr:flagellar motor protein MotB [Marivibrio halodurans]MBP5856799.1 OmpA family protein [Marivibrio halodurans]
MSDAFGQEEQAPLILVKKIKIEGGGHGGAWKVAYADFVTAMMAFFLLLWLLNATTEEQMNGISQYFAPSSVAQSDQGLGQAMAGLQVAAEGAMRSDSARPSISVAIPSFGEEEAGENDGETRDSIDEENVNSGQASADFEEQQMLDEAMARIKQSVLDSPEMADLQQNLMLENTAEGLRIQILDQQDKPMFEEGTDQLTRRAVRLLALIGSIVATLPNDITITGHTDATPPPGGDPNYTNWELSADRAASSRQWLVDAGLADRQVAIVAGKGDSEPILREDPNDPTNRRISILIVRESQPVSTAIGPAPDAEPGGPRSTRPDGTGGAQESAPARAPDGAAPPPLPE